MQFTASWSGEVAKTVWRKREITVDEGDLRRLCFDYGLDYELLSEKDAFELLEALGNMFLTAELLSSFPEQFTSPEYKQQVAALNSRIKTKAASLQLVRMS